MEERTRCWRLVTASICGLLLALLLLTAGGPTAHASSVVLSCSGTQTNNYSPPIRPGFNFPITDSLSEDYSHCTAPTSITGGHGMASYTSRFGQCSAVPVMGHYQITYTWSDGEHSTVDFTKIFANGQDLESTGTVTNGLGVGTQATLTSALSLVALHIICTQGQSIIQAQGQATLTFA